MGVTKAHDAQKNQEMLTKIEAVIPDEKLAKVLKGFILLIVCRTTTEIENKKKSGNSVTAGYLLQLNTRPSYTEPV